MKRAATLLIPVLVMAACVAARAEDDELARAQQRAAALSFVNGLGLTVEQATAMVTPLQRIQGYLKQYEEARETAVSTPEVVAASQQARLLLMADQEVPEETLAVLHKAAEDLELAQRALYVSVDGAMRSIARILTPEQNAGLDWTAPASVRGAPTTAERVQLQREIDARVRDGMTMLDRVKYLDNLNFITARIPIIEEYLTVNQHAGAPLPENAVEICIYYTDQARMVPIEEWQVRAPGMAAQMVSQLGLMPTLEPRPKPGAVTWWALYRLFTAPETLVVMQEIPEARQN